MSYVIQATLSNAKHPEYGEATISFPLSGDEYAHSINEVLLPLGIGDAISQDCTIESIDSNYEILQCLKGQKVNGRQAAAAAYGIEAGTWTSHRRSRTKNVDGQIPSAHLEGG